MGRSIRMDKLDRLVTQHLADRLLVPDRALERARTAVRSKVQVCPAILERFGTMLREILTTGAVPVPKAVIRSFVDRVEVDDYEIRIMPDIGTLEHWRASWVQIANPYVLMLISDLPCST